jgi:hypothetical protein
MFQKGELILERDLRERIRKTVNAMENSPSFFHLEGLTSHTLGLASVLLQKYWHTVRAPEGKSFLISDCPVITGALVGDNIFPGAGFAKENTVVLLPLTPKHCFVAFLRKHPWNDVAEPRGVDNVNRLIVEFGHRNVYANASSIDTQSLVEAKLNKVVFGENAFLPNPAAN